VESKENKRLNSLDNAVGLDEPLLSGLITDRGQGWMAIWRRWRQMGDDHPDLADNKDKKITQRQYT
jgi:hypothetical protein